MVNTIAAWVVLLVLAAGPVFFLVIYVLHLLSLFTQSRFARWLRDFDG